MPKVNSNTLNSTDNTLPETTIDINNLNLDDYIANQENEDSGGLFD